MTVKTAYAVLPAEVKAEAAAVRAEHAMSIAILAREFRSRVAVGEQKTLALLNEIRR
ncbi:hypothetical protein [Pseudomonas cedrina]|uniref:hypothetical protein n=1 Tax=Pseudomonas cedrina TaxID=651740 RepID=UPI002782C917|nr:hypothetical protein [Pseudomonas cedrina]MDQ0651557.1 L-asparaginase II [Pseudomonas cedrina]